MAAVSKEAQEKLQRIQLMEQNAQALMMQKQQFQGQLFETESALKELKASPTAFKIIGNIMVASDKDVMLKELGERKEVMELRLAAIEKQEQQIKDKAKALQEDIMKELKRS
jgi:prefoldin beta subunit